MATFQSKLHFLPYCVGLSKSNVSQFPDPILCCAPGTRSLVCFCLFSLWEFQNHFRDGESSTELKEKDNKSFLLAFCPTYDFCFFWCVFPCWGKVFLHLSCCTAMDWAELCLRHAGIDNSSVGFPDGRCPASPSDGPSGWAFHFRVAAVVLTRVRLLELPLRSLKWGVKK